MTPSFFTAACLRISFLSRSFANIHPLLLHLSLYNHQCVKTLEVLTLLLLCATDSCQLDNCHVLFQASKIIDGQRPPHRWEIHGFPLPRQDVLLIRYLGLVTLRVTQNLLLCGALDFSPKSVRQDINKPAFPFFVGSFRTFFVGPLSGLSLTG